MELKVETKQDAQVVANDPACTLDGVSVSVTPPIDEDYWLARVLVSDSQAVVCFPKFFTIGIGFQHEEDWDTNLPYTCAPEEIANHIMHNKGDDSIPDQRVIDAVAMLQGWIYEQQG